MPTALRSPCTSQPCPNPAQKNGKCLGHDRATDKARGTAAQRGYGAAHRRWRAAILAREPFCRCGNVATVADHITPLRKGGSWDVSNGQGMCEYHHNVKRATEDKQ